MELIFHDFQHKVQHQHLKDSIKKSNNVHQNFSFTFNKFTSTHDLSPFFAA